ncbi:hypothetical protein FGE12_26580 [Aggregicoccus sp. 17bor-14]|uniref:CPCC family cysteine-rich protein n=1 Tax=Myxococcaceae TaxID=31 RepID=UPI00129CA995|nr:MULTISPECIES: CPCC family cysteine-rich protein [Myxococcaceae]MBF5046007.1 hypothetical protein [Simulacricoccus sp. 17bor-14]MRI91738.1 hypothetical protein [Aggregicoccus sp. 17bor-14]
MNEPHPCPCCGYLQFSEPPGSYDICPICFWEDDGLQLEFATTLEGGANHITLLEAQRNYRRFGACVESMRASVRAATSDDARDPTWRPIDPEQDSFADWDEDARERAPAGADRYYWRPTFWRRAR